MLPHDAVSFLLQSNPLAIAVGQANGHSLRTAAALQTCGHAIRKRGAAGRAAEQSPLNASPVAALVLDSQRANPFADAHPHALHSGRSPLPRLDRRGSFHFRSFHPRSWPHPRTGGPQQRPAAQRGGSVFLHRPGRSHLHDSHGGAGRHPHRTQPSRRRQRNHRHARQRSGGMDFPPGDLTVRGGGVGAGSGEQRLCGPSLPRRAGTTREQTQVFPSFLRSPAARVLRGIPEDHPLRAGRQSHGWRSPVERRVPGRPE